MDKLFVFGDSHAIALAEGAKTLGLTPAMAYLSGNDWHSGLPRFHRRVGVFAPGRPGFQRRMRAGCDLLETDSILNGEHAIIASLGFQLGRLVPPILRQGHTIAGVSQDAAETVVSQGFVDALMREKRAPQLDLVRRLVRRRKLVIVTPPVLARTPEEDHMRTLIGAALQQAGAEVFDTRTLLPDGGTLGDDERHEDGAHGNALYGQRVMEAVREQFFSEVSLAG